MSPMATMLRESTGFSPLQIAGLKAWYDATRIVGDGNATNDGDAMAAWTDHSGSGNNLAQSTTANKPLYKTNITLGLPGVLFDGSNDWMSCAKFINAGTARTVIVAAKRNGTVAGGTICQFYSGSYDHIVRILWLSNVLYVSGDHSINSSYNANPNPTVYNSPFVHSHTWAGGNLVNGVNVYDNGSAVTLDSNGALRTETSADSAFYVGLLKSDAVQAWNGHIFEVLVYDTVLGTGDRVSAENYLRTKWATP